MADWLYLRLAHILAWTPWVLGAVGLASAGGLALLRRRVRPLTRARRLLRATTRVILWTTLTASVLSLLLAFVMMGPLFRSMNRMEATLGREMPEIEFHRVSDGLADRLSRLRGRVVLINLWATWCGPCDAELPTLNRLQVDYETRGLVVLTLSTEPRDKVTPFLAERAPKALNGYLESWAWLGVGDFLPHTLLVDRRGVLREFMFGSQDYEVFERRIKDYLE